MSFDQHLVAILIDHIVKTTPFCDCWLDLIRTLTIFSKITMHVFALHAYKYISCYMVLYKYTHKYTHKYERPSLAMASVDGAGEERPSLEMADAAISGEQPWRGRADAAVAAEPPCHVRADAAVTAEEPWLATAAAR
jgi:hypothetical protein